MGLHGDFIYLNCRVSASDDRSAVDLSYRKLKYALGVINIYTRGFGVSHRIGYPSAPLGKYLSASPIHLFDLGQNKIGGYLAESHYPSEWKSSFTAWHHGKIPDIGKLSRQLVIAIKRLDFSDRMRQAIILFQEGLEATHIDIALLKFWTGIELLCASDERETTERIVGRASSIFIDPKYAAMRLNFIQEFRNKIVHRGDSGDHALLCAQWGSIYLAELIRFFAFSRHRFKDRAEFLRYMSIPTDINRVMETISLYRKRLSLLKKYSND